MFMHGHVHTQFKVRIGTHVIMKLMPSIMQQSMENPFSLKLLHNKATLVYVDPQKRDADLNNKSQGVIS